MQITQIFFTEDNSPPPPELTACMNTVKNMFPDLKHVLYDLPSARELIEKNFSSNVLLAFDKVKPFTYKADLFRYCVLYLIGGWYFDIPIRCFLTINIPENVETIAFRDALPYSGTSWSCSNAILFARKKSLVMDRAIKLAVSNINNDYYGTNALCPTGPVLLGKVFAEFGESKNHVFGDYMFMTPLHHYKNPSFVLPSGQFFALGKEQFVNLCTFGAEKINNYVELWNQREIYK